MWLYLVTRITFKNLSFRSHPFGSMTAITDTTTDKMRIFRFWIVFDKGGTNSRPLNWSPFKEIILSCAIKVVTLNNTILHRLDIIDSVVCLTRRFDTKETSRDEDRAWHFRVSQLRTLPVLYNKHNLECPSTTLYNHIFVIQHLSLNSSSR